MKMDCIGNVSIGTATANEGGFGSGVKVLSIEGDTTADFGAIEMISTCAGTAGRLGDLRFINMNGTGNLVAQAGIRAISDGAVDSTAMSFFTEVTGGSFTEKMRITSTGNVGIGVTPTSRFHIQNSGTSAYAIEVDASDGSNLFGVWEESDGTGQMYLRDAAGDPKVLLDSGGNSYFTGGNVGIGTAAPATTLNVVGANGGDFRINSYGTIYGYDATTSCQWLAAGWTGAPKSGKISLYSSNAITTQFHAGGDSYFNGGNVGIGTAAPTCTLEVWMCCDAHCSNLILTNDSTSAYQSGIEFCSFHGSGLSTARIAGGVEDTGDGYLRFQVATGGTLTNYGYWDSDGNLAIGNDSPAHKLDVTGTAGLSTGTAWTNTSDSRIKTNVQIITGALSKIKQLRPVSFQYNDQYLSVHDEIDGTKTYNSFIAEEYEDVFPDAVSIGGNLEIITDEETNEKEILVEDLKQFTPTDLPIYLVAAVQELATRLEALESS
jgi:hypothetical protein